MANAKRIYQAAVANLENERVNSPRLQFTANGVNSLDLQFTAIVPGIHSFDSIFTDPARGASLALQRLLNVT
jgi:hypothetical protein